MVQRLSSTVRLCGFRFVFTMVVQYFFCLFQRFDWDRLWRRDEPIRLCCFSFFGHLKTSATHHHHRRVAFLSSSSSDNTGATITAPTQKQNEAPDRTQKRPNAAAETTWDPSQDDPGINQHNMPPPRKTTSNASHSAYLRICLLYTSPSPRD